MNILANILFRVLVIAFIPILWATVSVLLLVSVVLGMFVILKWDKATSTYKMTFFGKEIGS